MNLPSLSEITTALLTDEVLGAVLSGREPSHVRALLPEHFPIFRDREIWRVMLELQNEGMPIDELSLVQRLQRTTTLEPNIDWLLYVQEIEQHASTNCMLTLETNAEIMVDNYRRWKMIEAALDLTRPLPGSPQMPGARPRLTVHFAAEAYEPIPPTKWLIESLLAPATLVMFYGESDSKKTYSLDSMAASLAKGVPWLGFPTRQCGVLIIDEESGNLRMRLRMRECLNGVGADASVGLIWLSREGIKLDDPACMEAIEQLILEQHIDLVILDSLSEVTTGDENSKEHMKPAMSKLRGVVDRTQVCMLFIHHSRKDKEHYRGSTAIKDSLDMMIRVESKRGTPFVDFKMEKNRDGEVFDFSAIAKWKVDEAAPENNQFTLERIETRKAATGEKRMGAREHIIAYLAEHGESSSSEIGEGLAETCSKAAIKQAIETLEEAGTVIRTNPGEMGRLNPGRYILSSSEIEE